MTAGHSRHACRYLRDKMDEIVPLAMGAMA